jgi:hypothetical protein
MPNFYNLLRARKFSTAADTAVEIAPTDSATPNFAIEAGGKLKWSSGSATADTTLYRSAANTLKTDDSFDVASGHTYKIDGADVLTATSLGSSVVSSSLTSVGNLTSLDAATPNFTGPTTVTGNLSVTENAVWHTTLNAQTGTTYTLVLSDDGKIITMDNSSANTITVPESVNFPIGTQVTIIQIGTGQTTIDPENVNVNLRSTTTLKLRSQYSSASLIKISSTDWVVIGDMAVI